jgi:hypothetical protein
VIEQVGEMKPLGVGINLQPNAVRELLDLGFSETDLDGFGVPAREWALVGLNGQEIYAESRGRICRLSLAPICGASRPVSTWRCMTGSARLRVMRHPARLPGRPDIEVMDDGAFAVCRDTIRG